MRHGTQAVSAFDRQRFQQNARLAGIIGDEERRYTRALTDDDLEMVSAAGAAEPVMDERPLIPSGMHEEAMKIMNRMYGAEK